MPQSLDKLTIKGFKSIQSLENFELRNLNVLIGGNGAGKSNFIDFFRLMRAMMELPLPGLANASLQSYVAEGGGSDAFLFNGPKVTQQIEIKTQFGCNGYELKLEPTAEEIFHIASETISSKKIKLHDTGKKTYVVESVIGYTFRSCILDFKDKSETSNSYLDVYHAISSWKIYHFHDTSKTAPVRRSETIDDTEYLRFDAANIAPFLYHLKENNADSYRQIVDAVRLVAPFFGDFILKPNAQERVRLNWHQKGSDYPLRPYHLSDGTLRFICLATALLQPNPPSTMIIDEPELGLHPYAIEILAELIQSAAERTQLIVSTQSPALVDCFHPEDVVVVTREKGASVFNRLNAQELSAWLEEYSLGDLWRKGVVAAGPSYE
uniref:AAA family ATPase n=1 Tax=Candidatus Electronema sp. TaxID=2698783 RepID=UPI0040577EC0